MTQNDKDLLLKDLCARLPYEVKAYVKSWSNIDRKYYEDTYTVKSTFPSLNEVHVQSENGSVDVLLGYSDYEIKPYLFPLSSMTDAQEEELDKYLDMDSKSLIDGYKNGLRCAHPYFNVQDWYNKNHFDYRGLIPMGLANNATGLNIY